LVINSCKSKDAVSSSTTKEQDQSSQSKNMLMATVVDYSGKSDACGFLIELEESKQILQPIKIPKDLMNDGNKVWIDYTLSRRQQGSCGFGNPIVINEIKSR
jgi:hypothetical protein